MEPVILFTSPPNLEELCGITVLVKSSVQTQLTSLQPHITKCREIIFTEPDVIASPSYDLDACFNIVMQVTFIEKMNVESLNSWTTNNNQSLFKSGRVQARLQKLGCQVSKPYRVLPSLYQACLHYTMLARLAPVWNRAGEWLLQGRDFLMHTGYTNAIKMRLSVNKDEMFVSVSGTVVRFPPLQVEDLNLSQEEMLQILKSTEDGAGEVMLADSWCHVLPSMKRGRIMYVSLNISKQSPFTSYRDLQRHWKNMYGYRLPDTDEDILYCQVCFLPSGGGKYFTYPSVCLRAGPLQVVLRVDPKPILTTFLQDVHGRVGAVCGSPLRFQPKISFTCPSLHVAGQEAGRISLSSKPISKPVAPMRSQKSISNLYNFTNMDRQATVRDKLSQLKTEKPKDTSLANVAQPERILTQKNEKQVKQDQDKDDFNSYNARNFTNMDRQAIVKEQVYEQKTGKPKEDVALVNVAQTERILTQANETQVGENYDKENLYAYNARKKINNQMIIQQDGKENIICHSQPNTSIDQKHDSSLHKQMTTSDSVQHGDTQPVVANKFVPHFKPKQRCHLDRKEPTVENSECKITKPSSFKPVFMPCLSKPTSKRKEKMVAQSSETNTAIYCSPSSKLCLGKNKTSPAGAREQDPSQLPVSVPHFRNSLKLKCLKGAHTKPALSKTSVNSSVSDFKMVAEKIKQETPRSMKPTSHSDFILSVPSVSKITAPSASSLKRATEKKLQQSPRSIMNSPIHSDLNLPTQRLDNILLTPAHGSALLTHEPPSTPLLFCKSSQESNGWCKDGTQDGVKRKKATKGEDTPKKPRVKPQIQNLDVEALARSSQLGKVNTVTLTAWLKDRGVICRSKDKKNDLVEKVNIYINADK